MQGSGSSSQALCGAKFLGVELRPQVPCLIRPSSTGSTADRVPLENLWRSDKDLPRYWQSDVCCFVAVGTGPVRPGVEEGGWATVQLC